MERRFGRIGTYLGDVHGRGKFRRYREREDRRRRLVGQTLALLTLFWGIGYLIWHASVINWQAWYVSIPFFGAELLTFILVVIFAADAWYPRFHRPQGMPVKDPSVRVAVFVTVCGEPAWVVGPTIAAARRIDYPRTKVYVLDDGNCEDVRALAEQYGCRYLARPTHEDGKAGNLNYGLAHTDEEFLLLVDADQVVEPEIVRLCLGYFQLDAPTAQKFAFVQTAQRYHVPTGDPFGNLDQVFYRAMQPAKDSQNAAISCGSGIMYRREALESIGGFSTWNIVEDLHTSLCLHDAGWRSVFHNHPLSTGLAPDDVEGFYNQRGRWATDTLRMFFWDNPFLRKGLSLAQRFQYVELGWLYLASAFALPTFALVPIWSIFTGTPALLADNWHYMLARTPYLALMFSASIVLTYPAPFLKTFRMWAGLFPVHIVATFMALRARRWKPDGGVTEKKRRTQHNRLRDLLLVSPQLALATLSLLAVVWAGLQGMTSFLLWNSLWCIFAAWIQLQVPMAALLPQQLPKPRPEAMLTEMGKLRRAFVRLGPQSAALTAILGGAFLLRAWNLSYNSAFLDEASLIQRGVEALSGTPLSYLMRIPGFVWMFPVLSRVVDSYGGLSAVRFLNSLFGALAVLCVYLFARTLFNRQVACCAALFYALSGPAIFISRFGTYDAMSNALLAATVFLLARGMKRDSRRSLLLASVAAFLAVLAKYPAGFYLPLLVLAVSVHRKRFFAWKYFALPLIVLIGAYVGYNFSDLVSRFLLGSVASKYAKYEAVNLKLLGESAIYLGPGLLLALVALIRSPRHRLLTAGLMCGAAAILLYHFANQDAEAFYKHVAYGLILLAPAAALGLSSIPGSQSPAPSERADWGYVVTVAMLALLLLSREQLWGFQNFWPDSSSTISYLEQHLDGDEVLLAENGAVYNYYLRLHGPGWSNLELWDTFSTTCTFGDARGDEARFSALESDYFDYVILDDTSTPDLNQELLSRMGQDYELAFSEVVPTSLGDVTMSVFERVTEPALAVAAETTSQTELAQ
jgi:cellulose synthase (UDP-forming)